MRQLKIRIEDLKQTNLNDNNKKEEILKSLTYVDALEKDRRGTILRHIDKIILYAENKEQRFIEIHYSKMSGGLIQKINLENTRQRKTD